MKKLIILVFVMMISVFCFSQEADTTRVKYDYIEVFDSSPIKVYYGGKQKLQTLYDKGGNKIYTISDALEMLEEQGYEYLFHHTVAIGASKNILRKEIRNESI